MPIYMFLNLEGVTDASADHKGEIEVLSYSFGVSVPETNTSGGGGGAGKAMLQDLTIVKALDKRSPSLFLACATGKHIRTAGFTILTASADESPKEFASYKFSDVVIESVRQMGHEHGADFATEEITIDAARLTNFNVAGDGQTR